jgi:hypothetical protein
MAPQDSRNDQPASAADTIGGGGVAVIVAFVGLVAFLVGYDAPTSSIAKPTVTATRAVPEDGIADPQAFGPIKITPAEPDEDIATATIAEPAAAPVAMADEVLEPQAFGPIKITPAEPDEDVTTATIAEPAPAPVALTDEVLEPQAFGPIKITPTEPEDDLPTASIAKPAAAHPKGKPAHHKAKAQSAIKRARHGYPSYDLPSAKSALL